MASPQLPRPWFISFTAKWCEAEGFGALQGAVREALEQRPLPFYHLPVATPSWHSTVFAVLAIRDLQPDGKVPGALATELFQRIASIPGLLESIRPLLPLSAQPRRLSCFDNGTTVQFDASPALASHRAQLGSLLQATVSQLSAAYHGVHSLLDDPDKSRDNAFFGSVARSADPRDRSHLRWQVPLPPLPPLSFSSILLLVSDDALTNLHTDQNCRRITSG